MEAHEKEHIRKNLPNLLSTTTCTPMFLSHMHADGLISAEEEDILRNLRSTQEQSKWFYGIIQTRSKSFNCLKQALKETCQNGALAILEKCVNRSDILFKIVGSIAYCKTELLGRGCLNTKVYKGKCGWRDVAVKMISTDDIEKEIVMQEIKFLKTLDWHENIVRYIEQAEHKGFIFIALELCDTDLHKYVTQPKIEIRFNIDCHGIINQVTRGIEFLHKNNVIHRDLKPANILIVRQATGDVRIKLSDFGTAKKIPDEGTKMTVHTSGVGTEGWMAPEVLAKPLEGTSSENSGHKMVSNLIMPKGSASDIFSLGCIFYFVLTDGTHPFGDHLRRQVNIMDGKYDLNEEKIKLELRLPDAIKLIKTMIAHEDSHRPTAVEVINKLTYLNKNDTNSKQKESSDESKVTCHVMKIKEPPIQSLPTTIQLQQSPSPSRPVAVSSDNQQTTTKPQLQITGPLKKLGLEERNETYNTQEGSKNRPPKIQEESTPSQLLSDPLLPVTIKPSSPPTAQPRETSLPQNVAPPTDIGPEERQEGSNLQLKIKEFPINPKALTTSPQQSANNPHRPSYPPAAEVDIKLLHGKETNTTPEFKSKTTISNDVEKLDINWTNKDSYTQLHLMAEQGNEDAVRELVQKGADVNAKAKFMRTPLHMAVNCKNIDANFSLIKYLIESGADVFAKDSLLDSTFFHRLLTNVSLSPHKFHEIADYLAEKKYSGLFNIPSNSIISEAKDITPLHLAVRSLDTEEATLALLHKHGVNFNAVDDQGGSILVHAIKSNTNPEMISKLIKFGADIRAKTESRITPLQLGAHSKGGRGLEDGIRMIKYLIENWTDVFEKYIKFDSTFLHRLFHGFVGNDQRFQEFTDFLVKKKYSKLFNIPSDVGINGINGARNITPFHLAVRFLNVEENTMALLHEHGVNFNAVDDNGDSVLHHAVAINPKPEMISMLIKCGADFKHSNKNMQTVIHPVARYRKVEVLKTILNLGLDVNTAETTNGHTPLHYLVSDIAFLDVKQMEKTFEVARLLVKYGADVKIRDKQGRTPLELAEENRHEKGMATVIEFLKNCEKNMF